MDEKGIIKFDCRWTKTEIKKFSGFNEINDCRNKLHELNFIGVYDNGIGFGNISVKNSEGLFITGSVTGHIEKTDIRHYSKVTGYNIRENRIDCSGPSKASSETLSHAALYELSESIGAIIHIHNKHLWQKLINTVPTTLPKVEYGTPEMAIEIRRLYRETTLPKVKILVMAGHEEGIICFGETIVEAMEVLLTMNRN